MNQKDVIEQLTPLARAFVLQVATDAQEITKQRDELLAVLESFTKLYGRLWDVSVPDGSGFLSAESVKEYDNIHEQAEKAIARVKDGAA